MSENIDPKAKQEFLTMIGHSLEVLEGGLISDVNRQSIRNGILEAISNLMDQRDAANARAEAAEARVHELQAALDAAINMNIDANAKVVRLTAALEEANEDAERQDALLWEITNGTAREKVITVNITAGMQAHWIHVARVGAS